MRARVAAKSGKRGRWLPGFTPVCGPLAPASFFLARPGDPALGFASCRVSGASFAHLGRLDPALIIKARKIASSVSAHGFGRSMWLSAAVPSANPTP
jgi:hypothetical protein